MQKALAKQQFEENKIGWKKSFMTGFCQDENGDFLPWMCYPLIKYLQENLNKNDVVFEFGSGASTLFFAKRVKKVVAIESNEKWHEIMCAKIEKSGLKNIELVLMKDALENEKYDNYAKNLAANGVNFDLIIIDSLKRSSCTLNSIDALKTHGKLILDDSERPHYGKIRDFMINQGFSCQEFEGIAPAQIKLKKGWVFAKNIAQI